MPDRADVVVRADPTSSSVLVVVSGPATETLAEDLQEVLHRAAGTTGPHVRVDLTGCDVVAPAVVELLRAEQSRLGARGGSLSWDGVGLDGGSPADPGALAGRRDGTHPDRHQDGTRPDRHHDDGGSPDRHHDDGTYRDLLREDGTHALPPGEAQGPADRLVAAVRRRTDAVQVGPERSAAGQQLVDLLVLLAGVEPEQA